MYDNRYSSTFRSRRPAQCGSAVQEEPQSASNQRMQRFARYLENYGVDVRLARAKTAEVEIRWLD
ncbi:MAG: hypothetical protein JXR73_20985 [Candidatus Omnitrophica bacterium]|nr:hypothetical protein [Candidatus Omnitrophota bacterium]